ncbi:YkvA family protein [Piscinibacter gummiphilus]|uniref:DUF1232 domain-containing protein n=1 Tax=Piscinibacter gummiphilus TaxID=946333 RepID=A0A1W6L3M9_9BURK|nr:YkvA family protein [Piscinibacter gummiphilus]ARN18921.1 hypothetical protein A4W93_02750 [Piscinibacter gummiphilus]ATU63566.1 DUF1232 domain-containing protein [Piscinibacter gummiphilus]
MSIRDALRQWARRIKSDAVALWFAARHPDTPRVAKILCAVAVAYALSPIDLIPDFIPVLGYVDDVLLLPALMWLALRLLPPPVLADCRRQAEAWLAERHGRPVSRAGAVVIVLVWIAVIGGAAAWCGP